MTILDHWVSGAAFAGESTRTAPVYNPAVGTVQREVRLATAADVDDCRRRRQGRLPRVGRRPRSPSARRSCSPSASCSTPASDELAAILTYEHGKVIADALGEIARGLEVVEFAIGIPHLLKGEYSENVSTGVDVYSTRQPLGVVGIISPFNFPAMVPLWFFPIAIAAGNTVVLKPSEKDPSAAIWMASLLQGGRPAGRRASTSCTATRSRGGRAARAPGRPGDLLRRLNSDREVHLRERGQARQARAGARRCEEPHAGAADADLDLVADSAVNAGFGSAGERCMAISVVVAVEPSPTS